MSTLRRPALYTEAGTPALPTAPALRAVRSKAGHITFPPQRFGCQVSGQHGEELTEVLLTGRGRLQAFATVHRHAKPFPKTPFTVVEVLMEDGPVVRGLLSAAECSPLTPGATMVTVLEEAMDADGNSVRDLRFKADDNEKGIS
ncbi:Zn-ribbon domain-containing OB-fold protein [Variovorax sp. DT-64]|uniref:Zn-ribbon domain-containing OB-fold protein n=1 Tax=Variovorax sp. DT-64 TaxID=3396160 RepID=UPI003F1E39AC